MKKIAFTMVGAAALAAGVFTFAAPAYADPDPDPAPAPAPVVVPPGSPMPGNDFYSAQLPGGEKYEVQLAPTQPLPEDSEEDDEFVAVWF
jgi:hypothetical protein